MLKLIRRPGCLFSRIDGLYVVYKPLEPTGGKFLRWAYHVICNIKIRRVLPSDFAWRDNCWDLKSSGLSLLKAWRRKILGSSASSWHVSCAICSFFCRANHCFPVITATLYTFFSQSIAVIISSIPILYNSILISCGYDTGGQIPKIFHFVSRFQLVCTFMPHLRSEYRNSWKSCHDKAFSYTPLSASLM